MEEGILRTTGLGLLLVVLVSGFAAATAWAGPYSGGQHDPDNPYDPGVPGFVGPHGPGQARLDRGDGTFENPDNYVNPDFVAWATGWTDYLPSDSGDDWSGDWDDPTKALGPVTGQNYDIVSLGELDADEIAAGDPPGRITVTFDRPICDGDGADFAVFENGFLAGQDIWAELGYCEVSSNGVDFARFPSVSLTPEQATDYGIIDPTEDRKSTRLNSSHYS